MTAYIKGAPERVLKKCTTYLKDGAKLPITDEFRKEYDEAYNVSTAAHPVLSVMQSGHELIRTVASDQYMASRGHRVIACAQSLLPSPQYDINTEFHKNDGGYPTEDYCFVGLVSLEDPPKHGVREAIGTLRLAGIKVMMVTGAPLHNVSLRICGD